MNQVLTLVSDQVTEDVLYEMADQLLSQGEIEQVIPATVGPGIVLNSTDSFTSPEYKTYLNKILAILEANNIYTVESPNPE